MLGYLKTDGEKKDILLMDRNYSKLSFKDISYDVANLKEINFFCINRILINTTGGVVQPASPILEMIPLNDELILEVEVSPMDIAYVIKGQKAIVQLSAFDFAIYGSLEGEVLNLSADIVSKDDGSTCYVCLASIPSDGITSMSRQLQLLPGMQATVNIVSGSKTILKYLLQPVTNIKNKAFRER